MKTKGIAISTIIMLMLGVVVLLFVGYWLVRAFSGKGLSSQECKSQFISWCEACAAKNWIGTATWSTDLTNCLALYDKTLGITQGTAGDCATNLTGCKAVGIGVV
jgi:hypothetical protein